MEIKDSKLNYTLNVVCRWVVGLVFLFSSFVKGVDPMGTTFKVQEYMTAWSIGGLTFEWALPFADFMSVALICAEFLVGVLLITNAYRLRLLRRRREAYQLADILEERGPRRADGVYFPHAQHAP